MFVIDKWAETQKSIERMLLISLKGRDKQRHIPSKSRLPTQRGQQNIRHQGFFALVELVRRPDSHII